MDIAAPSAVPPPEAERTLATLLHAVQELSLARTLEDVQRTVRSAARRLVDADGATFVLRDGDHCFYADEDAISPLWKGQRFPLEACISGWSMLNRTPVVIEDIYADERIPHEAYRPTFVRSLVMVPIRTLEPLGAIGMYWADHHRASERQVMTASALADSTALALEHVGTVRALEQTLALSETDPLTGLRNRRAWDEAAEHVLRPGARPACVALIDIDDFKAFNDRHGHLAGDALLCSLGAAWTGALRERDLLARLGGDEFAVLMPDCDPGRAGAVAERLRTAVPDGQTVSVGIAATEPGEDVAGLMARADAALYAAKHGGRDRVVQAQRRPSSAA